jgi:hypothetical protein
MLVSVLLGDNIYYKEKHGNCIGASKEVGLEINVEKTKYMLLYRHQNVGQNQDIKSANRSFGNVSQSKYLRATVTNQNLIQEEIKRRLNSGNVCYHSVQNLVFSSYGVCKIEYIYTHEYIYYFVRFGVSHRRLGRKDIRDGRAISLSLSLSLYIYIYIYMFLSLSLSRTHT